MTQLYEAGVTKTTAAAAGPIVTLLAGAASRPDIREIGIFVSSAVAATIGIGRPAAVGAGAATGTLGQATDQADPVSTCTLTTSFATTQPTAPTNFMRRMGLPGTIGAGIVWVWEPQAFNIPASGNLVIWQISALAVTFDLYVKWEE
jgi:hypothetical protein